jgi:hypothetical protein
MSLIARWALALSLGLGHSGALIYRNNRREIPSHVDTGYIHPPLKVMRAHLKPDADRLAAADAKRKRKADRRKP